MTRHCEGKDMETSDWPLVTEDDDGIRPAGKPDECFYCRSKVGEPHGQDCACIHKLILARYTFDLILSAPHGWDAERFELHRNESSWCADNAVGDIELNMAHVDTDTGEETPCLCGFFEAKFLGDIDTTPRRGDHEAAKESILAAKMARCKE